MDSTPLPIPPDAELIPESVAEDSLYEALYQLSDPRRGQGERYELALILCLLIACEIGWEAEQRCGADPSRLHTPQGQADHAHMAIDGKTDRGHQFPASSGASAHLL